MSGLLSELACPYSVLTSGDVTQRLLNRTDCLLLLSMTVQFLLLHYRSFYFLSLV